MAAIEIPDDYFTIEPAGFSALVAPYANAFADTHRDLLDGASGLYNGQAQKTEDELAVVDADHDQIHADAADEHAKIVGTPTNEAIEQYPNADHLSTSADMRMAEIYAGEKPGDGEPIDPPPRDGGGGIGPQVAQIRAYEQPPLPHNAYDPWEDPTDGGLLLDRNHAQGGGPPVPVPPPGGGGGGPHLPSRDEVNDSYERWLGGEMEENEYVFWEGNSNWDFEISQTDEAKRWAETHQTTRRQRGSSAAASAPVGLTRADVDALIAAHAASVAEQLAATRADFTAAISELGGEITIMV